MNSITAEEKKAFREYFDGLKAPKTVAQMAADLKVSVNYVKRRLDGLGKSVIKKHPPLEGVQGRPAVRYEARR
jgi:predicted ArsR family transcriptional regulator